MNVGLTMIVRDEEERIGACLDSVLPVISSYVICDTGSTDSTIAISEEKLAGLPGTVWRRPWVNFGVNRTEALRLSLGHADYHLMLDADLILRVHEELPELVADEYVIHFDGDFDMGLPLLLKDGREWAYEGTVHAYLCCGDGQPIEREILRAWTIQPNEEGRDRQDKIRRDAETLEAEISPRSIFYLAQTYRDLGHKREAADLYRLRVRHSSRHPEEVFWACYQEGCLRLETEGLERAMPVLLEAWERRPTRAEPLYVLARALREEGLNRSALTILETALALPYPDDHLFLMRNIYEWGLRLEYAHTLIALDRTDEAVRILRDLSTLADPAGDYARNTLAELDQQMQVLPRLGYRNLTLPLPEVSLDSVSAVIVTRGNVPLEPTLEWLPFSDVHIYDNSKRDDLKVYGRFVAAWEAENDIIFSVDDDVIFTAYDELLAAYEPGKIVANMNPAWAERTGYDGRLVMIGAGALWDRQLATDAFDRYLERWPMDNFFLTECDFIFGTMAPWKRVDLGYVVREFSDDGDRLYQQPGQTELKWKAVERAEALKLG